VSQLQSQLTRKLTCRGRHIFTPPGWSIIYAEVRRLEQYNNTGGLEKSPGANVPAIRRLAEQRIALGRNQEGSLQRPGRSANFSRFDKIILTHSTIYEAACSKGSVELSREI
jgi:hypothetical protein